MISIRSIWKTLELFFNQTWKHSNPIRAIYGYAVANILGNIYFPFFRSHLQEIRQKILWIVPKAWRCLLECSGGPSLSDVCWMLYMWIRINSSKIIGWLSVVIMLVFACLPSNRESRLISYREIVKKCCME